MLWINCFSQKFTNPIVTVFGEVEGFRGIMEVKWGHKSEALLQ